MKKKIALLLCCVSLVLAMFTGCTEKLPAVYVQSVAQLMGYSNAGAFNTAAGVIMAQEEVKVERDMEREISGLCVELGQMVNEGDVLFIYKTGNLSLEIDRMNLEIEQMKNSINDRKSQIAQLEKEKKTAKESEKLAYTLQIQSLQTDQKEEEYNLALKQKELQDLKNNTDTGEVRSPISGEVKRINPDGGYDNYTGMPLPYIVLSRTGEFRIKGSMNELNREELYVGQSVIIRSRMDEAMTWTGIISSVENQTEDNDNNYMDYVGGEDMFSSASFPFYVTPDHSEGMLLGQHVFIEPNYGQSTAGSGLWLDASYIVISEEESFVWAADAEEKIEKRLVELGSFDEQLNRYEILNGLSKTDRIAFPNEEIQIGAPVTEVRPEESPVEGENGQPDIAPDEEGEFPEAEFPEAESPEDVYPEDLFPQEGLDDNELPPDLFPIEGEGSTDNSLETVPDEIVELPVDDFDAAPETGNGGGT